MTKQSKNKIDGWVVLNKPIGISSAHAVSKVKKILRPMKIGHAGTLDPLASGVLPLALGEATKTVAYMMDSAKTYAFTVTWGQERDTDDGEGEVVHQSDKRPTKDEIARILSQFIGNISQTPPSYSAVKLQGKRAYELARNGRNVEVKPRNVKVYSIEISVYNDSSTSFICHCGKGTYIRSLARDMGRVLGCYGYVSYLHRTAVGKFHENNAISLENLADMVHKGEVDFLQPVESALDDILAWDIDSTQAMRLQNGQAIRLPDIESGDGAGGLLLARNNGKPVAVCKWEASVMKPVRVFNLE